MHLLAPIALFLGAAAALQSPHKRVAKRTPKAPVHRQEARSVQDSQKPRYLNPKSQSMDSLSENIEALPGTKLI